MDKKITIRLVALFIAQFFVYCLLAQSNTKPKYTQNKAYAGIEVGSKGVKLSILEIGKNAKKTGNFSILKDTSVNTDFISFSSNSFRLH
ncbi:MAG: hypothetical protein IPP48_12420 [Chitinophagaceae bacterium]|nr:hypothetical protein [Chitinophagaceae bacterium]